MVSINSEYAQKIRNLQERFGTSSPDHKTCEQDAVTPAIKHDAGKLDLTLIPWEFINPNNSDYELIKPLYLWWTRRVDALAVPQRMESAYRSFGIDFVRNIAEALNYGATQYPAWNWYKGISARRLYAAACRHYLAFTRCEEQDIESGLSHLSHLASYAVMIQRCIDDRPEWPTCNAIERADWSAACAIETGGGYSGDIHSQCHDNA